MRVMLMCVHVHTQWYDETGGVIEMPFGFNPFIHSFNSFPFNHDDHGN